MEHLMAHAPAQPHAAADDPDWKAFKQPGEVALNWASDSVSRGEIDRS
jgi:hypothetical protein